MTVFNRILIGLMLLAPCAGALAQITLYEHVDFRGHDLSTRGPIANLKASRFNDVTSSIVIERGTWEVCQDANYRGRCQVLGRGAYPSMQEFGLNDRISSVRPVSQGRGHSGRGPAQRPDYAYRQRPNERLYEADITSVLAIHGHGRQQCWVDERHTGRSGRSGSNVGGAIVGGVIGGIIGHQIGDGSGRTAATVGGAAIGAAIGSRAGRNDNDARRHDDHGRGYDRNLPRCRDNRPQGQPVYWDVSYEFRGVEHWVRMQHPPGRRMTVNGQGEPRG